MATGYRGSKTPDPHAPHADLAELIRHYGKISGRGLTAVCRDAAGDDKLLWDLQGGRNIGPEIRKRVTDYVQHRIEDMDADLNELETMLNAVLER